MPLPPNLCYTIALDKPGENFHHRMARLLVTSLIRTGWHGRIVVFRNHDSAVLPEVHPDVEEQVLDDKADYEWGGFMHWRYDVSERLNLAGIGKVLYLDCDIIALRSINHLMMGSWDIYTTPEPASVVEFPFNGYLTEEEMTALKSRPGLNAGTVGFRAEHFMAVTEEWRRIDATEPLRRWISTDQHSWNRLVLDTPLRHRHFGQGEIQFPFIRPSNYLDYRKAALVHALNCPPAGKLGFLYGLWMECFGRHLFDQTVTP